MDRKLWRSMILHFLDEHGTEMKMFTKGRVFELIAPYDSEISEHRVSLFYCKPARNAQEWWMVKELMLKRLLT